MLSEHAEALAVARYAAVVAGHQGELLPRGCGGFLEEAAADQPPWSGQHTIEKG